MFIIDAPNHIGFRTGRKGQTAEEIIAKMDEIKLIKQLCFLITQYPNNDYVSEAVKKIP